MKFVSAIITTGGVVSLASQSVAFAPSQQSIRSSSTNLHATNDNDASNRRSFITTIGSALTAAAVASIGAGAPLPSLAADDGFNVDNFLKTGAVSMPMGVSGQGGKARPETGIIFRDGSDVSRDTRSGDVSAEILLGMENARSTGEDPIAVLASYSSPWPLAKGTVYDVECRDANTGDSAFLSVSGKAKGKSVEELPSSFFTNKLFGSTGRFSFYGPPTDVKVRKSYMEGNTRILEVGFSILSQSTGAEIPRNAIVAATIPSGTDEAVMLVGSSTSTRWKKGAEAAVRTTIGSFRAVPAPKSAMKVRAKDRTYDIS